METPPAAPPEDSGAQPEQNERIGLIDLLLVLARHRLLAFGLPLLCAALAVVVAVNMKDVYSASAQVVPVQASQSNNAAAILGQLNLGSFGSALNNRNAEFFTRIMRSRKVGERMVQRFDLIKRYEVESASQALGVLARKMDFAVDAKSGVLTITVDDWNPVTSADMTNFLVQQLVDVTREITVSEATQRRVYFERQLAAAQERQRAAEAELKAYQTRTGVYGLDHAASNTLAMIAKLEAEIAAKNIQLRVMRTTMTDDNPQMLGALEQLKGLRAQLATLKSRGGDVDNSVGRLNEISGEYSRLWRELKYQESVIDILVKQFELAKLDEGRDMPSVQVLDYAVVPERHDKPRRKLMVIAALMGGGLLGFLLAFVAEAFDRARREPVAAHKLRLIRRHLLSLRPDGEAR